MIFIISVHENVVFCSYNRARVHDYMNKYFTQKHAHLFTIFGTLFSPCTSSSTGSGRRLARLRQQKLAVHEALLKKRQELNEMQARIEQDYQNDCKKLQMDWEMRLASLRLRDKVATGNSIKAGEEQEKESKKVELRDQVRRYEVESTMAKQAEATNVDLGNLCVATFGSGASVDNTAGKSGADRTLEGFSSDSATVELSFEVRVVETTVQTRSVSKLCLATPANVKTPEIQNLPNNISVTSFANDEVCLDTPLQNHGLVPARSYARMDRQK